MLGTLWGGILTSPTCVDGDCSHYCAIQIQTRLPTQKLQSCIVRIGEHRNASTAVLQPGMVDGDCFALDYGQGLERATQTKYNAWILQAGIQQKSQGGCGDQLDGRA